MILLRHMEDTYSYLITIIVCWLYIGCCAVCVNQQEYDGLRRTISGAQPIAINCIKGNAYPSFLVFSYNTISPGIMGPTVIDTSQPIGSIGLRLRDHTRTFDSGVRTWSNYRTRGRISLPPLLSISAAFGNIAGAINLMQ
jgi:hypothetical protein